MSNSNSSALLEEQKSARAKKIAITLSASLVGISTAAIISGIVSYDAFFPRFERPDYALYPGMYCYERFEGGLVRQTMTIPSGEVDLAAYYDPVDAPKGLVIIVHGIHAGGDDFLPMVEAMVQGGYAVFTYDATGNYSSGGDSGVGMCQQLVDLDAVLCWLEEQEPYRSMPKFLIGHSWGGYAAASALALHSEIKACVCIAPMCDGTTIMVEKSKEHIGDLAYTVKPIFDAYQWYLFGDYTRYNAVVGINSTDVPVVIVQGLDDTVITPDGQSITAYLDELTNPNVSVHYTTGLQGSHMGVLHSVEAEEYIAAVRKELERLEWEKGEPLTYSEKTAFYQTIDHRLYSEFNPELISLILETFDKAG